MLTVLPKQLMKRNEGRGEEHKKSAAKCERQAAETAEERDARLERERVAHQD